MFRTRHARRDQLIEGCRQVRPRLDPVHRAVDRVVDRLAHVHVREEGALGVQREDPTQFSGSGKNC